MATAVNDKGCVSISPENSSRQRSRTCRSLEVWPLITFSFSLWE